MPGVLIIEALAQLGCLFSKMCTDGVGADDLVVFSAVEKFRFRRPVVPGDTLTLELTSFKNKFVHWKMEAVARVGDRVVADGILKSTAISS